jgi:hypothetical protein
MKTIFDPSFRYTPSHSTDVRRTFERIRRELAGNTYEKASSLESAWRKVLPMPVRQEGKK